MKYQTFKAAAMILLESMQPMKAREFSQAIRSSSTHHYLRRMEAEGAIVKGQCGYYLSGGSHE